MDGIRVVSLVPSTTETLLAWGITPVACTRFCEQPQLTHVGGTKNPDIDAIVRLDPDLVVMDEEENREQDFRELLERGLEVLATGVRDLPSLDTAMGELAARVGGDWEELGPVPEIPVRLRCFVPIWRRPWMALGQPTYGAALLAGCAVESVFREEGPYPEVTLELARRAAPDLVLAPSEPYPFGQRHLEELTSVAPTVLVDGKDLFWWGARTRAAMQRLRCVIGAVDRTPRTS